MSPNTAQDWIGLLVFALAVSLAINALLIFGLVRDIRNQRKGD